MRSGLAEVHPVVPVASGGEIQRLGFTFALVLYSVLLSEEDTIKWDWEIGNPTQPQNTNIDLMCGGACH
jgi:hypothetical protein